jgi:isopenicillin N synthase-like dioxygenase
MADMGSTDKITSAAVEKSGKFIHIKPTPGAILVNPGYLLMRWTNGRWKNIVHRVSEPPRSVSNETAQGIDDLRDKVPERYSIAFFSFPDAVTIVEPLANCCTDQSPKKWSQINAGEYLLKKRTALYSSM